MSQSFAKTSKGDSTVTYFVFDCPGHFSKCLLELRHIEERVIAEAFDTVPLVSDASKRRRAE